MTRSSASVAVSTTMRAIREMLMEGCPVALPCIGLFCFGLRRGRTIKKWSPKLKIPRVQPDSFPLKFQPSPVLKKNLKGVVPKHLTYRGKRGYKP